MGTLEGQLFDSKLESEQLRERLRRPLAGTTRKLAPPQQQKPPAVDPTEEYLDDEDVSDTAVEHYLDDEDDDNLVMSAEHNPIMQVEKFLTISTIPHLGEKVVDKKCLANTSTLLTYLRKCFTKEFDTFEASLRSDGTDLHITITNLEQCLLTYYASEAAHLAPLLLSLTVMQCNTDNDKSTFLSKAKVTIGNTWRSFFKNATLSWKELLLAIKTGTVPATLTEPNPTIPNAKLQLLDPCANTNYMQAYKTVRIMLKSALLKTTEVHTSIEELKQAWKASMPGNCTDVEGIIAKQAAPYRNLKARLGQDLADEERVLALKACFTVALKHEFDDQFAQHGITKHRMPWMLCIELAKKAQIINEARISHAGGNTYNTNNEQQQLVHPANDSAWTRSHRPELVSFGICSRFLKTGDCTADGCPFEHGLPHSIDLASQAWTDAVKKAAPFRARLAEKNEHTGNNPGTGGMRSVGVQMPTVAQMRMPNTTNNSQVAAPATVGAPAESLPVSPREPPPTDAMVTYHAVVGAEDWAAEQDDDLPPLVDKPLVSSAVLEPDESWDLSNMTPMTVMQRP